MYQRGYTNSRFARGYPPYGKKGSIIMSSNTSTRPRGYIHAFDTPRVVPMTGSLKQLIDAAELPNRKTLHYGALNPGDLKPDTKIRWVQMNPRISYREARVINRPYRQLSTSPMTGTKQMCWMVLVETTNSMGEVVNENWYLAAMGVAAYWDDDGVAHWNCQAYTIAV